MEQKYSYINMFRWVYTHLHSHRRKQFWLLFLGMTSVAILETCSLSSIAFFASSFTDPKLVLSSDYVVRFKEFTGFNALNSVKALILFSGILMVVLISFKNSVKALVAYFMARFSLRIEAYFGSKLLNGFLNLPYQWHITQNTADLVYAVEWRSYLGRQFFQPCLRIFNSVLMVLIMLVILFVVQPFVSLIVVSVIGTTSVFIYKVIKTQIDKIVAKSRDYMLAINKEATMAIHGIKDVKIAMKEDLFVAKFQNKAVPLSHIFGFQSFLGSSPVLLLETVGFGMLCLSVFTMLLLLDVSNVYMTGTLAILGVTAWKALPAANEILSSITKIRNALPFISTLIKYFDLFESDRKILEELQGKNSKDHTCTVKLRLEKSIRFKDISFAYKDSTRNVLDGIDFSIKQGETTGIIGTSGAGKSTMVDLLIGLLVPQKGSVIIDDIELEPNCLSQWLRLIGYVPQTPYIYDGTLAENVAFGLNKTDIDRNRVRKCCKMASMDDFVHDLPNDIDSEIGERGIRLSGGQQQRVAVARALYNQPEVMIFDEATSSLDNKSEKAIQQTIYSFKGRKTLIIIAHRLNTVKDCDSIIWLEKGQVVMHGSAEKVLKEYQKTQEVKKKKAKVV